MGAIVGVARDTLAASTTCTASTTSPCSDGDAVDAEQTSGSDFGVYVDLSSTATGTGVGSYINNTSNNSAAVYGSTEGGGDAVQGYTTGDGNAVNGQIANSSSSSEAVVGTTNGSGAAVAGRSTSGPGGEFEGGGDNGAIYLVPQSSQPGGTCTEGELYVLTHSGSNSTGLYICQANTSGTTSWQPITIT
jgi:hypothetical protein